MTDDTLPRNRYFRPELSLRFVYRIWNDETRSIYFGLSFDWRRRYSRHIQRPARNVLSLLDGQHRVEPLTERIAEADAAALERRLINDYRADGWNVLNCRPGGDLGGGAQKWTFGDLKKLADQCASRGEFVRKHRVAAQSARYARLIDDLFAEHPNQGRRNHLPSHWTRERITDAACECATRAEMMRKYPGAWNAARKLGIWDGLFQMHPNSGCLHTPPRRWTLTALTELAAGCKTRSEMRHRHKLAFECARRRGWLDQVFANHENGGMSLHWIIRHPHRNVSKIALADPAKASVAKSYSGQWPIDRLQEIADRHASRWSMACADRPAYTSARERGLVDVLFAKHPNNGYASDRYARTEATKRAGGR